MVQGSSTGRPVLQREVDTVVGPSDLWGNLVRVGGNTPKATLRLRRGKLQSVEVSEALARELGRLLYCDVGIEGVATWRLDDWSLVSFVATAIMEYRPDEITPTETFRRLAEASGGRWEGVDADEYVRRLRYEDDRRCF